MRSVSVLLALAIAVVAAPAVARAEVDSPRKIQMAYAGPRLGVQVMDMTDELRVHMGAAKDAGVLIGKVAPGSAAEKAGIKVGDVLVSVANKNVTDANDVRRALSAQKEGSVVAVQVVRDRRPVVLSAVVPKPEPGGIPFEETSPGWASRCPNSPAAAACSSSPAPIWRSASTTSSSA
jgi:S1-C subfamily serine protease